MRYPVMIEAGDENTAWGVAVPDLLGCFAAGGTLDEAKPVDITLLSRALRRPEGKA